MATAKKAVASETKRSLLDVLEKGEREGGTGGGGYVGNVLVEVGYKIFVAGLSNAESFFPYDPFGDDAQRNEALAEARQSIPPAQPGEKQKKANSAIQFTLFKSSLKGDAERAANWKGDRVFTVPQWTEAYKQVVKPAIAQIEADGHEIPLGEGVWMHLAFKPDPSGKTKDNYKFDPNQPESAANPREVEDWVAYPARVFDNEQQAEEFAAGTQDAATVATSESDNEDPINSLSSDAAFIDALTTIATKNAKKPQSVQDSLLKSATKAALAKAGWQDVTDDYLNAQIDTLRALAA